MVRNGTIRTIQGLASERLWFGTEASVKVSIEKDRVHPSHLPQQSIRVTKLKMTNANMLHGPCTLGLLEFRSDFAIK
jgi:hypothetical protein